MIRVIIYLLYLFTKIKIGLTKTNSQNNQIFSTEGTQRGLKIQILIYRRGLKGGKFIDLAFERMEMGRERETPAGFKI